MDFLGTVIVLAVLGALGWLAWSVFKTPEFQESLEDVKEEFDDVKDEVKELLAAFPTVDELKKLTKRELLEIADKLGLDVDEKLAKAKVAEEIDNNRP